VSERGERERASEGGVTSVSGLSSGYSTNNANTAVNSTSNSTSNSISNSMNNSMCTSSVSTPRGRGSVSGSSTPRDRETSLKEADAISAIVQSAVRVLDSRLLEDTSHDSLSNLLKDQNLNSGQKERTSLTPLFHIGAPPPDRLGRTLGGGVTSN
jgi:hypothetical protein